MFGAAIDAAIAAHAREAYPHECCGLVVSDRYVRMRNIAADPRREFAMEPAALLPAEVRAVVHSHPDGPAWPSAHDMRQQIASGLPWGLVTVSGGRVSPVLWWGPGVPIPPLLGRIYRPGPSGSDGRGDCYAIIRDWYAVARGIVLPDYPRDPEWERSGGNMYLDNFADAGFREVPAGEAREGDVVLARLAAPVPNHGGVVLPDGRVLHHLREKLSTDVDRLGRWSRFVTHTLRYGQS